MRIIGKNLMVVAIILCNITGLSYAGQALVKISSATYSVDEDTASAMAVDNSGNIYITGKSKLGGGDSEPALTMKFDSNLNYVTNDQYEAFGKETYGNGITVDKDNNIIVVGHYNDGVDNRWFMVKYNQGLDTVLSSGTYNHNSASGDDEEAYDVVTDDAGNIYVTGCETSLAQKDYITIKYDSDFVLISSAVYACPANQNDIAYGIDIDSDGNIFVTGQISRPSDYDYFTIKYNSDLIPVSSATYKGQIPNRYALGRDLAIDSSGNVFVTGFNYDNDGMNGEMVTIKYDNDLVLISSSSVKFAVDDNYAFSIAVDPVDNVLVSGSVTKTDKRPVTIRYDNNLIVISSQVIETSAYKGSLDSVAADRTGNIFVTGEYDGDYIAMKYNGLPFINSLSPSSVEQGKTVSITVNTNNCLSGLLASFSGTGLTIDSLTRSSSELVSINLTADSSASAGVRSLTLTNIDGASHTKAGVFSVVEIIEEEDSEEIEEEVRIVDEIGEIKILGSTERKGVVNPDKGDTVEIQFKGIEDGTYKLKIYTLLGETVYSEEKESISEGKFSWIPDNIASGIYIVSVRGPGVNINKKFAILR